MTPPGYYCPRPFTTAGFNIWFTIGANHFCDPYPARYCVTPAYQSVYTQRVAYKSPDRGYVQQYTQAPIRTATVQFKYKSFSRGGNTQAYAKSRPYTPQAPYSNVQRGSSRPQYKALDTRPTNTAWKQQYQPQEARRTPTSRDMRPFFETHRSDMRGVQRAPQQWGGGTQQTQRETAPSQQDVRSANRGGGNKGNGREVVKMKGGGNGRGNGKH
jgi:hypothetical protein